MTRSKTITNLTMALGLMVSTPALSQSNTFNQNYLLLQGTFETVGMDRCQDLIATFKTCLGANPESPYVIPMYQAHPSEFIDPSYPAAMSKTLNGITYRGPNRLHPTEARVIIFDMPERAAYFGYQTYLFSKKGQPNQSILTPYLPDTHHPNTERVSVFNSISNAINHQVIAEKTKASNVWSLKALAIISSADQQTIDDLSRELTTLGIPQKHILVEKLGKKSQMGLSEDSNDYLSLLRYALPEKASGKSFYDNPPAVTFRVIAKNRSNSQPLSDDAPDDRSGNSEAHLETHLKELAWRVQNKLQLDSVTKARFIAPINVGIDTYKCETNNTNCLGDTRDTDTYLVSGPMILGDNDYAVIAGVNHNKTGNSSYFAIKLTDKEEIRAGELTGAGGQTSFGISQAGPATGFAPENIPAVMDGSAQRIVTALKIRTSSGLKTNLDKFWVKIFVRDPALCGGHPDCLVLSDDRTSGVAVNREVGLMRRVYLKPNTTRGPEHSQLLDPIMYKGSR